MEGGWRTTMPAGSLHGVFEITVERFDIPVSSPYTNCISNKSV
jgi:hypothetical protein